MALAASQAGGRAKTFATHTLEQVTASYRKLGAIQVGGHPPMVVVRPVVEVAMSKDE